MNTNKLFMKIPNYLVYIHENSYEYKDLGGKTIMGMDKSNKHLINLLINLSYNVNRRGDCKFTIVDIIGEMGLKIDNNGSIIKKVKVLLQLLVNYDFIYNINLDISKVKPNDLIICKLREDYDSDYFQVYYDDYELIKSLDLDIEEKISMLNLYCYIASRYRENYLTNPNDYTVFTYNEVIKHLNMGKDALLKARKNLIDNGMLYSNNIGKYRDENNKLRDCSNVYSYSIKGLDIGLKKSREWYTVEYGKKNVYLKND